MWRGERGREQARERGVGEGEQEREGKRESEGWREREKVGEGE